VIIYYASVVGVRTLEMLVAWIFGIGYDVSDIFDTNYYASVVGVRTLEVLVAWISLKPIHRLVATPR
jgi:hypothetical protein